jgi:hypothetical protein
VSEKPDPTSKAADFGAALGFTVFVLFILAVGLGISFLTGNGNLGWGWGDVVRWAFGVAGGFYFGRRHLRKEVSDEQPKQDL